MNGRGGIVIVNECAEGEWRGGGAGPASEGGNRRWGVGAGTGVGGRNGVAGGRAESKIWSGLNLKAAGPGKPVAGRCSLYSPTNNVHCRQENQGILAVFLAVVGRLLRP